MRCMLHSILAKESNSLPLLVKTEYNDQNYNKIERKSYLALQKINLMKKPALKWSSLALLIALTLTGAGSMCAMGHTFWAFHLIYFGILVILGLLSLKLLRKTVLFNPLEGSPSFLQIFFWWEKRRIPANLLCLISLIVLEAWLFIPEINCDSKHHCGNPLFFSALFFAIFIPLVWNCIYSSFAFIDFLWLKSDKKLASSMIMNITYRGWLVSTAWIAASIIK